MVWLGHVTTAQALQAPTDDPAERVQCLSKGDGDRTHCPADTSGGVALARFLGPEPCLLGKSWGYDDEGVWVTDGCGADFVLGQSTAQQRAEPRPSSDSTPDEPPEGRETWGVLDPGEGFLVGKGKYGSLSLSAYAMVRYLNQLGSDSFVDHLGRQRPVDRRQDIYSHRVIVYLKGWMGVPQLVYAIALWTVNTTDQDAIFGNLGYQFAKWFNLYAGINGNPGTRSMQGSHPYWLGHDRVMADEFFRPFFTQGAWANGEPLPGLWYSAMVGNSSSTLGVTAAQLDRDLTYGGSLWWMPTTHEFGPRGAFNDWEHHEQLATRFGASSVYSPEERYTSAAEASGNTALKLADSVNVFETGSLAPEVTLDRASYTILSADAGLKYRGLFLQTEFYNRWLNRFRADGPLPMQSLHDWGFYVQASCFPLRKRIELYAATSQIFGDEDAGFGHSAEYLGGLNLYITKNTPNHRFNFQWINVHASPVGSTFGYYAGGQTGNTVSLALSTFF